MCAHDMRLGKATWEGHPVFALRVLTWERHN